MPPTLALLHTAPALIPTFEALLKDKAPDIELRHIVAEDFLQEARDTGVTSALTDRIHEAIAAAATDGADVVMCTCSSIGGPAESAHGTVPVPVIRVDRPMAAKAVATGPRIIVAAALRSTLGPTSDLVRDAAQKAGKDVQITEVVCDSAWPHWEKGDAQAYHQEIADTLRGHAASADVIVLAQASMAGAAALCADLPIPVLSSPALGVEAAVAACRRAKD